jgi:hypothetical protein
MEQINLTIHPGKFHPSIYDGRWHGKEAKLRQAASLEPKLRQWQSKEVLSNMDDTSKYSIGQIAAEACYFKLDATWPASPIRTVFHGCQNMRFQEPYAASS